MPNALEQNAGRHASADIASLMIQRKASGSISVIARVNGKGPTSRAWSVNSYHSGPMEVGVPSWLLQPSKSTMRIHLSSESYDLMQAMIDCAFAELEGGRYRHT